MSGEDRDDDMPEHRAARDALGRALARLLAAWWRNEREAAECEDDEHAPD